MKRRANNALPAAPIAHAVRRATAAVLATLLAASSAQAASPCVDGGAATIPGSGIGGTGEAPGNGIGGTGRTPSGDDGIGGTGEAPGKGIAGTGRAVASDSGISGTGRMPADENGIGGTGRGPGEGGIGGTGRAIATRGIFGTVTGYASVCVAGLEVAVDAQVLGANAAVPAIGETVEITATGDGDSVRAVSLQRRPVVVGKVEAIDRSEGAMRVLGQDIVFDDSTRVGGASGVDSGVADSGISVGEDVRVSGLRRPDGRIVASRIDAATGDGVLLQGRLSETEGGRLAIGSLPVDTSALAPSRVRAGEDVVLHGHLDGGRLVATSVDAPLSFLAQQGISRIDVEAFAGNDGRSVVLDGRRLALPHGSASGRGTFQARRDANGRLSVVGTHPPVPWRRPLPRPPVPAGSTASPSGTGRDGTPAGPAPIDTDVPGNRLPPPPSPEHPRRIMPEHLDRPERPEFPDRPPPRPPRPDRPPPPPPPPPPPRPERPQRPDFPRAR